VLLILQYAKNCGFYRFHKEYLQMLKDAGIIVFRPSNWVDAIDEVVESVECQIGGSEQRQALEDKQRKKALSKKMDNVTWKMNLIIVAVVCVVFGCLLGMYSANK
jgi:t-SNARE complex subunit (syntaxin)